MNNYQWISALGIICAVLFNLWFVTRSVKKADTKIETRLAVIENNLVWICRSLKIPIPEDKN